MDTMLPLALFQSDEIGVGLIFLIYLMDPGVWQNPPASASRIKLQQHVDGHVGTCVQY